MQSNRLFLAIAILLIFFYFSLVFNPVSAVAQVEDIPDPNLRAKIEEALGKGAGDIITVADMETLTELNAPLIGITDLTGIELAANLTTLNLSFNDIADLSPISALTSLRELFFIDSHASDVSPFVNLTNLKILELGGAHDISDISPLAGLTNLKSLSVWRLGKRGDLSDISVVANFPHLTYLNLGHHQIADISVLAGLTDLTQLYIGGNNISDISALVANTGLGSGDTVDVRNNPLNATSFHTHIPALQSRGVTIEFDAAVLQKVNLPDPNLRAKIEEAIGKGAGDTITVADMETLTQFSARGRRISDLTGLEFATNLTLILNLRDNNISDISPLANLTNLEVLLLEGNKISDISPLSGLTNLKTLDLGDNAISDLSPLANLTNLKTLRLRNNVISDITPMVGLTNLAYLWLDSNAISNISAVAELTNLTELYLAGNPIENASVLCPLLDQNPDLKVDIEIDCELLVGVSADTDLIHIPLGAVKATALLQNYPNPFNPETWIPYQLADDAFVTLTIHDESGGLVRSFDVGYQRAGVYQNRSNAVYWDGRNESGEPVGSGVYFYQLDTGDYSKTRKMLILK